MLLEAGADTIILDESQSAPLHTAVRTRDENIVKVDNLIQKWIPPRKDLLVPHKQICFPGVNKINIENGSS